MKDTTISLGWMDRPDGTRGELLMEVSPSGSFAISHMHDPLNGILVGSGHFNHIFPGMAERVVEHLYNKSL